MDRPLIIAHRARLPGVPEHAISSLPALAEAGADIVEIDVRLSLDRKPVVHHDAFLGRTTRGRGWVRLWPAFLLRRLPLRGSPAGDRVAPLSEMLKAMPAGLQPGLHLKDRGALRATLRAIARHGDPDRTWLWLERPRDVLAATRRFPGIRCTLLRAGGWTPSSRQQYLHDARRTGARAISVPWGVVTDDLTQAAHAHGLLVFAVQEPSASIAQVVAAGLDGIITSDPANARQEVERLLGA